MKNGKFTPTQQAMLDVLADGRTHRREELHACLPDSEGTTNNISVHLTAIRKVIRPVGQDILCVWEHRKRQYRLVRLINTRD